MSLSGLLFILKASRSDKQRDAAIPLPAGIREYRDISYSCFGNSSLLDVYCPENASAPLPTIVSIHGGGYVYGSKEIYRRFGMDMAKRGFAFVNFNYRLSPKWKFPTPLVDTNSVLEWIEKNHRHYQLDPDRIILIGDSAGAQLTSHYAAIHTNPQFAALFPMKPAKVRIRAIGLYCGMYDLPSFAAIKANQGLARDYLGRKFDLSDPRLKVLDAITGSFPPAFIMTGTHDFLRSHAQPMYEHLAKKGVHAHWKCYGTEENQLIKHVFHVNILLPESVECNDDAAAFFRQFV